MIYDEMFGYSAALEDLYEEASCNPQPVHGFKDLSNIEEWNEEYNCDDFEVLPCQTDSLVDYSAVILRSYDDTTINSGITQSIRLSVPGAYIFSADIHIPGKGIDSGVHSVTPGIYLRICAEGAVLAESNFFKQAELDTCVYLRFAVDKDCVVHAEIRVNGRGSAIVDNAQMLYVQGIAFPD